MKTGEIVKWVLIILAVWIGFKAVNRLIGDIPSGNGGSAETINQAQIGVPTWAPNTYSIGVYGPLYAPWNPYQSWPRNPFFASPERPQPSGWWSY